MDLRVQCNTAGPRWRVYSIPDCLWYTSITADGTFGADADVSVPLAELRNIREADACTLMRIKSVFFSSIKFPVLKNY